MSLACVLVPLSRRTPRARRYAESRAALADALRASGALAGAPRALPYEAWPRTDTGAPAVVRGWHASLADATGLALALVAPFPVAVDAEWRHRARLAAVRERFAASGELARLGDDSPDALLVLWTAKEALLKLAGVGLAELGLCTLLARADERVWLTHRGHAHEVLVRRVGAHWIAVAGVGPGAADSVELHELQEVA